MIKTKEIDNDEILASALQSSDASHRKNVVNMHKISKTFEINLGTLERQIDLLTKSKTDNHNSPRYLLESLIASMKIKDCSGAFKNKFDVIFMQDSLMQLLFTYISRLDASSDDVDTSQVRNAYEKLSDCLHDVEQEAIKMRVENE